MLERNWILFEIFSILLCSRFSVERGAQKFDWFIVSNSSREVIRLLLRYNVVNELFKRAFTGKWVKLLRPSRSDCNETSLTISFGTSEILFPIKARFCSFFNPKISRGNLKCLMSWPYKQEKDVRQQNNKVTGLKNKKALKKEKKILFKTVIW